MFAETATKQQINQIKSNRTLTLFAIDVIQKVDGVFHDAITNIAIVPK